MPAQGCNQQLRGGGFPISTLLNRRILVVEDEAMIAMLIEDTLRADGALVAGMAATVAEAQAMIEAAWRTGRLDAAVVDLNLNGESALPILDLLRARGVPHVVATGYGETPDVGGVPVLHKPFDEAALLDALRPLLAERSGAG